MAGLVPTGWNPTAVSLSADGQADVRRQRPDHAGPEPGLPRGRRQGRRSRLERVHLPAREVRLPERAGAGRRRPRPAHPPGGGQQRALGPRRSARRADHGGAAPAHQARHLHHQGEPHLRPDPGRPRPRQRRPEAGLLRPEDHAELPRPVEPVRDPRQLLRSGRGQRRRLAVEHLRPGERLRPKVAPRGVLAGRPRLRVGGHQPRHQHRRAHAGAAQEAEPEDAERPEPAARHRQRAPSRTGRGRGGQGLDLGRRAAQGPELPHLRLLQRPQRQLPARAYAFKNKVVSSHPSNPTLVAHHDPYSAATTPATRTTGASTSGSASSTCS